ncbi:MAG: hypothetical protein IJU44_11030 [Kiritimatiellae bacterium]|nr:hypothetical protein [Kiritimatiellia bacterium]
MRTRLMLIAGTAFAAVPLLYAADGIVLATSTEACVFRLDTSGETPIVVSSQEELSGLMPIGWGKGDNVTVTSPDGATFPVVSAASEAGSETVSQHIQAAGVWLLENSTYGIVKVGVQWSVFGGGGQLAESDARTFVADTVGPGPDRRGKIPDAWPAIAYTGNSWGRNSVSESSESTLTLVPPHGAAITASFTGNGAMTFSPKQSGLWNIILKNESQTLVGTIFIPHGFLLLLN